MMEEEKKDINLQINRILHFAILHGLMQEEDRFYGANLLLKLLDVPEYEPVEIDEELETATPILEKMLDYAVTRQLLEDTVDQRDLFDTAIMNCLMGRPSEVIGRFWQDYQDAPDKATDNYYKLSIASNYIRKSRIDKNIVWKTKTEYGDLDITINLSKPEKDPRDIAAAKHLPAASYPKCLLCRENEGYAGNLKHPARQTHRIIPLELAGHSWFLQYSPYTYYNEHCIIFNSQHVPMKISRDSFVNLLNFLDILPHYFAGSNADLPIVGGSILTHDHYQGGRYCFAMEKAPVEKAYSVKDFPEISIGRIKWPMSAIRLESPEKEKLIQLADRILQAWRQYSDESVGIMAYTDGIPHNTITPITRKHGPNYVLDLVLRNNRTDAEHPLGIFHPHSEVQHIKKENIGLIEVMGLAVLPARLSDELLVVRDGLLNGVAEAMVDTVMKSHGDWYRYLLAKYRNFDAASIDDILKQEVGEVFLQVLTHAGVFKRDESGMQAFDRFMASLND